MTTHGIVTDDVRETFSGRVPDSGSRAHAAPVKLTQRQQQALAAAFKKGGAWYGLRGGRAGGAYSRMCERMAAMGLVGAHGPHEITLAGLVALRDLWLKRWGKSGCMAYQLDLEAVQAALDKRLAA